MPAVSILPEYNTSSSFLDYDYVSFSLAKIMLLFSYYLTFPADESMTSRSGYYS